ncbi:hypothetical protein BKA70DRAFT_1563107 [Coprinopsis sp. MPI-PUGE-AT-0042]|nr:hypothetical protein BKA70DRAFT_1563107 [Coprinopsis sp. MPI-PUGE-AT-0042]
MPDTRANKRARVEEDPSPSKSTSDVTMVEAKEAPVKEEEGSEDNTEEDEGDPPKRSDAVWYDDGNIILQAGSLQFRVHKSILSKYSTVFKDMFKVPQPLPTAENTLDGCPIIKMEGDEDYNWEWLLELLYDGRRSYADSPRLEYSLVESLITLGDKYKFDHLLKEGLSQFEETFPRRLTFFASNEFPKTGFDLDDDATLCHIVDLAKNFKIETSLPALYYFILIQKDFPVRGDGVGLSLSLKLRQLSLSDIGLQAILHTGLTSVSGNETVFDSETIATLIVGRDRIYKGMATRHFRWLWPDSRLVPAAECTRQTSCRSAIEASLIVLWRPVPEVSLALQPYNKALIGAGLCRTCTAVVQADFQREQKAFWRDLPTYFGLPAWAKLSQGPRPADPVDET